MKPIVAAPIVALALAGAGTGAYFLATSGGEEEAVIAQPTPTPSAEATADATPEPTVTLTPEPSPDATANWKTYVDPGGLFTVRYPPTWFQSAGQAQFSSYDLSSLTSVSRPPESATVEVSYRDAAGSDTCGGTLSVDPKGGQDLGPLPGATPTILADVPAWQLVREKGDPAIAEEDLTRIHRVSVIYKGYCALITAYYTQGNPDVSTFEEIVSTFRFTQ
jgi:hypothetical protein